jgi:hypothetical protein
MKDFLLLEQRRLTWNRIGGGVSVSGLAVEGVRKIGQDGCKEGWENGVDGIGCGLGSALTRGMWTLQLHPYQLQRSHGA